VNKHPKISIIVPVYKTEQYLPRCIESILSQTVAHFELVLIDDGSPDNSGNICDEYATKDDRIIVFHQKNSGVSIARNNGIKEATGEYLCFVDSDDWLIESYLEDFFINLIYDADFYIQGYTNYYERNKTYNKKGFLSDKNYTSKFIRESYIYAEFNKLANSACFKLFKRDFVQKYNIEFDRTISYGEDHLFVLNYMLYIDNMCVSRKHGYNYIHRVDESLTNKYINHDRLFYYATMTFKVRNELINKFNIEDKQFSHFIQYELAVNTLLAISSMYSRESNLIPKERKLFLSKYILYLNSNKILDNIRIHNYYFLIMSKIISMRYLSSDSLLFLLVRLREFILNKMSL
jgi:glycosyltransferase involved in cell wall biosynthesis